MAGVICFHKPEEANGWLSNWYLSDFTFDGVTYSSMEHYMMHRKALVFHDAEAAAEILSISDVARIKEIGRGVSNYDDRIWNIGLSMHDPRRLNIHSWNGQNLLGFALMAVRERLRK